MAVYRGNKLLANSLSSKIIALANSEQLREFVIQWFNVQALSSLYFISVDDNS